MKRAPTGAALNVRSFTWRLHLVGLCLAFAGLVLMGRAVHLQVFNKDFLNEQAAARHLRIARVSAHRGPITDRNGEALAVSTPVDSIWANPRELVQAPDRIPELARALGLDAEQLARRLARNANREFMYLRRHMNPGDAAEIAALDIPGVELLREYRRYYPAGEVVGHLVGFTNVDDEGQEGLELAFDHWLAGRPGRKKVLKDSLGRVVEDLESIETPNPGRILGASIDLRIQYLAYRELKSAVQQHGAQAGSLVVLDVTTGEVLAMVNQPAYNPNDRAQFVADRYRNRAITDIFEPGSTLKPMVVAAALESGKYRADSRIDTNPGFIQVGAKMIEDKDNLGRIDLATVLARSSNVGATKIAMSLEPQQLFDVLSRFGLGRPSASGYPGESGGLLSHHSNWRPISQATLAYGYGLSMTALQLAQAYAVIGTGGLHRPVSLIRVNEEPIPRRVLSAATSTAVLAMLEDVVGPNGTGLQAAVSGYRIGGKTGTARKFAPGGYAEDRYTAVFAGVAPVTNPRLAIVVVIDDPSAGEYYGGTVAAPVFSEVAAGALRIMAVPPDDLPARSPSRSTTIAANAR
ncbi:MAG: penicillin-binding transpeptidase domain-containing protein [Gammaproteobacteria bacterium]|nr:penicillin-binding transpeptidase domain-containing protein [Gammaproteobacteria bacterium]